MCQYKFDTTTIATIELGPLDQMLDKPATSFNTRDKV